MDCGVQRHSARLRVHFPVPHRGKKILTDQDTVVLADFDNSTGDPVFDSTLRRGMAVQLEQSPYPEPHPRRPNPAGAARDGPAGRCAAYSSDGAGDLRENGERRRARRFDRSARKPVCPEPARKGLHERQGPGRRAGAGSQKRRCTACAGSDCRQIQNAGRRIPCTVEKYDTPLAEATTPSLEALKAYSLGCINRMYAGATYRRSSLLFAGGGTRSEFRHGLRGHVGGVYHPARAGSGDREYPQGL